MKMQMQRRRFILSLLFTISLFHLRPIPAAPTPSAAPSPAPVATPYRTSNRDFLRTKCNTTKFYKTCYSTLLPYAGTIHKNPAKLVNASISVCHSKAQAVTAFVSSLSHRSGTRNPGLVEALDLCAETLGMAVDEIEDSLNGMKNSTSPGFDFSDVQTWMSSALTDAGTCVDEGFEGVADGPEKSAVISRTVALMDFNRITLDFIASITG